MLNFPKISLNEFLTKYWQKQLLLIPNAFPQREHHISADELAGLAMEEDIESRLVIYTPEQSSPWKLQRGPFSDKDFNQLPNSHWTLLVQGVDRFVPEIARLLDYFNFIPQWRIDDVMISYAVEQGSVGPHYDHYDVFLYQAQGRRKWRLTTTDCIASNYLADVDLRIMKEFKTEQEYILEEGDMLYLPPGVGHHGISLDNDCITYSFGFRSYQTQELWDSFGEYLASKSMPPIFYRDPPWTILTNTSKIPALAWEQARELMQTCLNDDALMQDWFGAFATQLDQQAESLLPLMPNDDELYDITEFRQNLLNAKGLVRNPLCRFAYVKSEQTMSLYINGGQWDIAEVTADLVEKLANQRTLLLQELIPFLNKAADESFLFALWETEWVEFLDD